MKKSNKVQSLIALRSTLWCAALVLVIGQAWAQQIHYRPTRHPAKDLPMHSVLYDLDHAVTKEGADAASMICKKGLVTRADGKVNVEIINQKGQQPIDPSLVNRFGGEADATWRHRVSAWVPPGQLIALVRALPAGFYMEQANVPELDDEGPGVTGSDAYRDAGANGSDIRIAIIDGGFSGLPSAQASLVAPATYTGVDYVGGGLTSGTNVHGTGCVETAFDHAPGATYFLYRIGNLTHMGNAVNHAVKSNVDIISHSISRYNTGWEDNSGDACAAVATATANGILFFTSAGNRAQQHWQGDFNAGPDADGWHDWADGDECLNISWAAGDTATFYLSWNTSGGTYDYDLYLFDQTCDSVLASSTNGGNNYEKITWGFNTGATQTVQLAVRRNSGGTTEMEVFLHKKGTWQQFIVPEGSTASPSNSTEPNCISVGAVHWNVFTSPPGTDGIIRDYSSLGPTNGGATRPQLCGPTNTNTVAYGGDFTGTSSSTPNAAGAAAALWSSAPYLSASGVRYLLLEKAEIFKDWGDSSFDNIYGRGGIQLHTYHVNTIWVDRDGGNTSGSSTFPYYYVSDAQSTAVSGGRIVFLGQNYPEPIVLDKELLYEAIGGSAVIGE